MSRWIKLLIWLGFFAVSLSSVLLALPRLEQKPGSPAATVASMPTPTTLKYWVTDAPNHALHTVVIPTDRFMVVPAISASTAPLEAFAEQHQALAALNGGFFDPQNQQSTSYVRIQGQLVADPTTNDRLMQNPDLANYLNQILDRTEFRRYQCDQTTRYDIVRHSQAIPANCQLLDVLGAGPELLPNLTLEPEGFTDSTPDGTVIRDAIGRNQPNARTAIGLTEDGRIIWVMVAQKPGVAGSGMTLPELAAYLKQQGAIKAMNLDGGSSSSLFIEGDAIYGKRDAEGKPVVRPVKSVLLVQPAAQSSP